MNDKVILYTRQHENSLYELKNKGRITNKEIYVRLHMLDIAPYFIEKYRLFVKMAEKIVPRPEGSEYPIWCSISKRNCLRPIEKEVVYEIEVPKSEVIYFDGGKWDYVLNNIYIPKDEEDRINYHKEIDVLGVNDEYNFIDGKYKGMYPEIEEKIRNSWDRIFQIDNWSDFVVQANIWNIKKDWVLRIIKPGEKI
ncbi:DUF3841 domain-containing protein [Anaerococcus sp. Marseille-P3625]|uniref:DUF3841 domain-containing protein n=1 Tax=Anaerococcus sp. Marseille-P3625 TaxID=1977277 RepID=UPI000C0693FB|nr:DUF3841 domain-containing protein [Anaerococcus sp. Marseille-P3625]